MAVAAPPWRKVLLSVGYAIDHVRSVIAEQQRPIVQLDRRDRPSPRIAVIDDEAGYEIFVFACWDAVLHPYPDQLVTCAESAVPRAVERRKSVPHVLRRKSGLAGIRGIEHQAERGGVGLVGDIGNERLVPQIRPIALEAGIL